MDWKLGWLIALLCVSFSASAQNGWERFGEMLGGGDSAANDRAFNEAREGAARIENALASVRLERKMEETARLERELQGMLAKSWVTYGLPEEEAQAVAATFRATNEQAAINARVERDGWRSVPAAAKAAYQSYNYLLANQLLVAAYIKLSNEISARPVN